MRRFIVFVNSTNDMRYVLLIVSLFLAFLLCILNGIKIKKKDEDRTFKPLKIFDVEAVMQYKRLIEMQKLLDNSEEKYRLLSQTTNDAIWMIIGDERYFSDRWFEITGYTREEIKKDIDFIDIIHDDDKEAVIKKMMEHKLGRTSFYEFEYRIKTKDGAYKWILSRAKALFNENGEIDYVVGSHTDINKLKVYELKLQDQAYHDQLSGLKNRAVLNKKLNKFRDESNGR